MRIYWIRITKSESDLFCLSEIFKMFKTVFYLRVFVVKFTKGIFSPKTGVKSHYEFGLISIM